MGIWNILRPGMAAHSGELITPHGDLEPVRDFGFHSGFTDLITPHGDLEPGQFLWAPGLANGSLPLMGIWNRASSS